MKYFTLPLICCFLLFSCSNNNNTTNAAVSTTTQTEQNINANTAKVKIDKTHKNASPTLLVKSNAIEPHYCTGSSIFFYLNEEGNQLSIYNTLTNESKIVLEQEGLKNNVSWAKDCNNILFKFKENYKIKFGSVSINGNKKLNFTEYPPLTSMASLQYSDTIFYLDQKTLNIKAKYNNNEWNFGNTNQKYYNLMVSPNGKYLAANKGSEIVLINLEKNSETSLGKGLHTSWHNTSTYLIGFLDESADGHQISNSDIYMWDINTGKQIQITHTMDIIEAYPSFKDKETIIYTDLKNEGIYELNIAKFLP